MGVEIVKSLNFKELEEQGIVPEETLKEAQLSPQEKAIYFHQLKFCRKMKFEDCDIYAPKNGGSGFLLEEGDLLWTDYHVIESFVKGLANRFSRPSWMAYLTLEKQNIPIFIFDKNKNLIFSGSKGDGRASALVKPFDNNLMLPLTGEYKGSSDFVLIKLSRKIGRPLMLSENVPEIGEKIYAIGYPTGTGEFRTLTDSKLDKNLISRSPFPDAKGSSLHITSGEILDSFVAYNRMRIVDGLEPLDELDFLRLKIYSSYSMTNDVLDFSQLFFSTVDAVPGNSGGPLVNHNGQVIGMAGSVTVELKDNKFFRNTLTSTDLVKIVSEIEEKKHK